MKSDSVLSANEARVLGCLLEKSVVTPDQYPLTLNALTNACNQKSGRDPVMSLAQGVVQHTIRELEAKNLVRVEENFKSRVEKYVQRFCNSQFSDFQFDPPQFAIVCLLLLRGPQTPGELRARSGRLHTFADNAAVTDALTTLIEREANPLVVQLPRTPGRKDPEYMHLFCGAVDVEAHVSNAVSKDSTGSPDRVTVAELAQRVSRLEAEVAELKADPRYFNTNR
ncbi:MAG: YceH family protein [Gammaproteobacteria bacterium]|nr:MAG: YceH family protein [Gammaproteobacteria bacterium]